MFTRMLYAVKRVNECRRHDGQTRSNSVTASLLASSLKSISAFAIVQEDLEMVCYDMKKELNGSGIDVNEAIRIFMESKLLPTICVLMAKTLNHHINGHASPLLPSQRRVAVFLALTHAANVLQWNCESRQFLDNNCREKQSTSSGEVLLALSTITAARILNNDVFFLLTGIPGTRNRELLFASKPNEPFQSYYLLKTFKKIATLLATTCQAVAILGEADPQLQEMAFQYGHNVGMALQVILILHRRDFLADGKCEQIFDSSSDFYKQSLAIEHTRFMALKPSIEALELIQHLKDSVEKRALVTIPEIIIKEINLKTSCIQKTEN